MEPALSKDPLSAHCSDPKLGSANFSSDIASIQYRNDFRNKNNKWQDRLLGPTQGLEKILYTENKQKTKIKDGNNSTKIGASNIFGGNQLRFQISAQ